MKTVKMKKVELKSILIQNLAKHDNVYNEALENYWKEVEETFNEEVEDAKEIIKKRTISNGGIGLSIHIQAPVSYKESYQEALAMIEYEVDDIIQLTHDEFNSYILNKWDWTNQFMLSNSAYASETTMINFSS